MTEYNIVSNWDTIDHNTTVPIRKRDIEALQKLVRGLGFKMSFHITDRQA